MGGANTQFVTTLVLPFFVFFARCPGSTAGPIVTREGSTRVFGQGSAFGGLDDQSQCLGSKVPKNVNFGGGNKRFKPNL